MRRFAFLVVNLLFLILSTAKVSASDAYYFQNQSDGELFAQWYSWGNGALPEEDFWTNDRVTYIDLRTTSEPFLFQSFGAIATTSTDQYVDHINLWMSGPGNGGILNAWYSCNNDTFNWSRDFDSSVLTDVPKKVTFYFDRVDDCNLKNASVTRFGVYRGKGNDYPQGIHFLASDTNPTPNAGLYFWDVDHGSILDDYDVKAEIWTRPEMVPILIIPGVMGTDILKDDNKLWLDLGHNFSDIGDEFMDPLQFKIDLSPDDSGLELGNIVKKETVNVGVGKITVYDYSDGLTQELKNQGYTEGTSTSSTIFTFPYDWRYGVNEDIINQLKQKIQDIMSLTGSDKVDVVAHSTGGLIVKKYVMENPQDHHIGKAVFVGVPNLGSLNAIKMLLQGDNFYIQWLDEKEIKKIAQNLPVVYQLSPSQEYFNKAGSFLHLHNAFAQNADDVDKDLNYKEATQFLEDENLVNPLGEQAAEILHTKDFDNFNLRSTGVDFYNIVGCKTPTLGQIEATMKLGNIGYTFDVLSQKSGDGTVPQESALAAVADDERIFYAIKADHGKMLSADGIRQQIVNLVSGSSLAVGDSIKKQSDINADPNLCKPKGKWFELFSPLTIDFTDQFGNHIGLAEDGSVQNTIPGASFQVWGEHKFVFLPTDAGQVYSLTVAGTGSGVFTLKIYNDEDDSLGVREIYSQIPVTDLLRGKLNFSGETSSLSLDNNNDGVVDQTLSPNAVLPAPASHTTDLLPPHTSLSLDNSTTVKDSYQDSVQISLVADDWPFNSGAGVYKIFYKLDDATEYSQYDDSLTVTDPGTHILKYYSIDNLGNVEPLQEVDFSITSSKGSDQSSINSDVPDNSNSSVPAVSQASQGSGGGFSYYSGMSLISQQPVAKILGASIHGEGSLIIFSGDQTVYLISNGVKHPFYSAEQFLSAGFKFADVQQAFDGDKQLMLGMPFGEY